MFENNNVNRITNFKNLFFFFIIRFLQTINENSFNNKDLLFCIKDGPVQMTNPGRFNSLVHLYYEQNCVKLVKGGAFLKIHRNTECLKNHFKNKRSNINDLAFFAIVAPKLKLLDRTVKKYELF